MNKKKTLNEIWALIRSIEYLPLNILDDRNCYLLIGKASESKYMLSDSFFSEPKIVDGGMEYWIRPDDWIRLNDLVLPSTQKAIIENFKQYEEPKNLEEEYISSEESFNVISDLIEELMKSRGNSFKITPSEIVLLVEDKYKKKTSAQMAGHVLTKIGALRMHQSNKGTLFLVDSTLSAKKRVRKTNSYDGRKTKAYKENARNSMNERVSKIIRDNRPGPDWYTTKEAAEYLGIKQSDMYWAGVSIGAKKKKIKMINFYQKQDLDAYLERMTNWD
jgi:hypothetical protein